MSTPHRIRNEAALRAGQPDLDSYNHCFAGLVSPRFCGSDVDGVFVFSQIVHGVFERRGSVLVLEHKAAPESWELGQWIALNVLAEIGRATKRLFVIATYGENANRPDRYHRLPVKDWRRLQARDVSTRAFDFDDPYSNPVGIWIRMATGAPIKPPASTRPAPSAPELGLGRCTDGPCEQPAVEARGTERLCRTHALSIWSDAAEEE